MAATTMSASIMAAAPSLSVTRSSRRASSSPSKAVWKVKNFDGLKPVEARMAMGQSTEAAFAAVRAGYTGKASRGGALAANCDVASEIFKIVPIMSALTLAGIAIGFVLLRVEAAVEESE